MLRPKYTIGCKRRIFDATWLPSLHDPKVDLTNRPLLSVHSKSVVLGPSPSQTSNEDADENSRAEEKEIPADVIVLATGYEVSSWLTPLRVIGKNGAHLQTVWNDRGGPHAYMGTAVDGFPNFFMICGPNSVTGHNSVMYTSEIMVGYVIQFIRQIVKGKADCIEVKREAETAWTDRVQRELQNNIISQGGCTNWYKAEGDWNAVAHPRSQIDYTIRCMFPRWSDWKIEYTSKGRLELQLRRILKILFLISIALGAYLLKGQTRESLLEWQKLASRHLRLLTANALRQASAYLEP